MLGDIAISDGRRSSSQKTWESSSKTSGLEDLGRAKRVVIDKDNTTIVEGAGKKSEISGRIAKHQEADRGDDERLRPRETPGASGKARRWSGGDPSRSRHRGRDEGTQSACRGCPSRDPCGDRGGHSRREGAWRLCAHRRRSTPSSSRGTTRQAPRLSAQPWRNRSRLIAQNAGIDGAVTLEKVRQGKGDFGYNAETGEYRRSRCAGHHRSDQGGACCPSERVIDCGPAAHYRGRRDRASGAEEEDTSADARGLRIVDPSNHVYSRGAQSLQGPGLTAPVQAHRRGALLSPER